MLLLLRWPLFARVASTGPSRSEGFNFNSYLLQQGLISVAASSYRGRNSECHLEAFTRLRKSSDPLTWRGPSKRRAKRGVLTLREESRLRNRSPAGPASLVGATLYLPYPALKGVSGESFASAREWVENYCSWRWSRGGWTGFPHSAFPPPSICAGNADFWGTQLGSNLTRLFFQSFGFPPTCHRSRTLPRRGCSKSSSKFE